jgi:hypothetical protein
VVSGICGRAVTNAATCTADALLHGSVSSAPIADAADAVDVASAAVAS